MAPCRPPVVLVVLVVAAIGCGCVASGSVLQQRRTAVTNCQLGSWSGWGRCTAHCGGGTRVRTRPVVVQADSAGATCDATTQVLTCNTTACPTGTGEGQCLGCTSNSGGECKDSNNVCYSEDGSDGSCPGDSERCTDDAGVPVACTLGPWGNWSTCTHECGTGNQLRVRSVVTAANHNGACDSLLETRDCNIEDCPTYTGVDCGVSAWSAWSACQVQSTRQNRTRTVEQVPDATARPCPDLIETRDTFCPVDCVPSAWGQWSNCTSSSATQTRTRTIVTPASNGGAACANMTESRDSVCVVDCGLAEWGAWGACSPSCGDGNQTRTRAIATPAMNNGTACPSLQLRTETQPCNAVNCSDVRNCTVSDWSAWSACVAGDATQLRTRTVTQQPYFGTPCPLTIESRNTHCIVDCQLGEWGDWHACSSATPSTRQRTRDVTVAPANGGTACDDTSQTEVCDRDCVVSEWSAFGACIGTGAAAVQNRTRSVVLAASGAGAACPPTLDTQSCGGTDSHCLVGAWSPWSACTASCGGGTRVATRAVDVAQRGAGDACPTLARTEACNEAACANGSNSTCDNCWSGTAGSCRNSASTVCYAFVAPGTPVCPGGSDACDANTLPADCTVGDWGAWGDCGAECGTGTQVRSRSVVTPGRNGGSTDCALTQSRQCNAHSCTANGGSDACNCVVSAWSAWGTCSVACGGGTQTTTRTITTAASNGGAACGDLSRTQACNVQPCGNDTACGQCWSSTSGPCRAADAKCYPFVDPIAEVCPPATNSCAVHGDGPSHTYCDVAFLLEGVTCDVVESTFGSFVMAAAMAEVTQVGPDVVTVLGAQPQGADSCDVTLRATTPDSSAVAAAQAAAILRNATAAQDLHAAISARMNSASAVTISGVWEGDTAAQEPSGGQETGSGSGTDDGSGSSDSSLPIILGAVGGAVLLFVVVAVVIVLYRQSSGSRPYQPARRHSSDAVSMGAITPNTLTPRGARGDRPPVRTQSWLQR